MVKPVAIPQLKGARFTVSYMLSGDEELAGKMARDICFEETVEFPEDLTPAGDIMEGIVGRIDDFKKIADRTFRADISYALETAGGDLVQFLTVVFGNISIKPGIRVDSLDLPRDLVAWFRGPRFGAAGLREILGIRHRPLICTALKPMGLPPKDLAGQAYDFALGGIDLIKDDHGLADHAFCGFEDRVKYCAEAVGKANRSTGLSCAYVPNITGPAHEVRRRAEFAKREGAGGLLISPMLTGFDMMRLVAEDDGLALPIIAHPAFSGSFVTSGENGMSHRALYGQLMRLAGADASVFPNFGGRFSFSREECEEIVKGCREDIGGLKSILPAPGGGMTTDRARDLREIYGLDFILLIGAGLHRRGDDLTENSRYFIRMLDEM